MSFEPFLAGHTAEIVGLTVKCNLELRRLASENRAANAANWIFVGHSILNLTT
jgi:hypothetical protein